MAGFDKSWKHINKNGINEKLRDTLRSQDALKPRIEGAVNKLQMQITKLDSLIAKTNERDSSLFKRIVDSMQRHDSESAKILSNELAEVRKISKTLSQSRLALEQVSLRLSTITDMGDAMAIVGPAMASIKGVRSGLGHVIPGADAELNNMQNLLSGIMMESVQGSSVGVDLNSGSINEIDQIMMEASAIAEQSVNDKFPSIPTSHYRISTESEQ